MGNKNLEHIDLSWKKKQNKDEMYWDLDLQISHDINIR